MFDLSQNVFNSKCEDSKTFVIDTNVLINDPRAFYKFEENEVVIPLIVIQELDGLKKRQDTTGQSAREVARLLDELRTDSVNLSTGAKLPNGGTIRVYSHIGKRISGDSNDLIILNIAKELKAILITDDINLRIIADSEGVDAQRYKNTAINNTDVYAKSKTIKTSDDGLINALFTQDGCESPSDIELLENEYVYIDIGTNNPISAIYKNGRIKPVINEGLRYGIKPKNNEQLFAWNALFDENISLVALSGPAGTGKTILTIAAGLCQIEQYKRYEKFTVCRPIIPVGRDIGFLPGNIDEKIDPWMGPIQDNIEVLIPPTDKKNQKMSSYEYLKSAGIIQVAPLTFLRGRSLPNQLILVDEAQNLTRHEIKTILTRAGKNTKIVLSGDPYQIDSPYLDEFNNGMAYVIDKFRGNEIFAHVTLTKGERSFLAETAARIL